MKEIEPIPYRHSPKGLTILQEDRDIIVIDKSSGLLTVKATYEKEKTAKKFSLLEIELLTGKKTRYGFISLSMFTKTDSQLSLFDVKNVFPDALSKDELSLRRSVNYS